MSRLPRIPFHGLAFTLLLPILLAPAANAALTIDVFPKGDDVVAIGYGTANTAALTFVENQGSFVFIWPNTGAIQLGVPAHSRWSGMTGPANYGTGGSTIASTWSGSAMGRVNFSRELALPQGYVSGTAISATATWPNATLASLGATPGIYTWTWGSGPTADSFTIRILAVSPMTVTTTADLVDPADGHTSLREAIAYANTLTGPQTITFSNTDANGAVNFHDGTARTIQLAQGQLSIGSSVTIVGPGADRLTVRGNWNGSTSNPTGSRVFNTSGSSLNVEISGMTVSNGAAVSESGGAFLVGGNALTLRRCVVRDCFAAGSGGGIRGLNATVNVIESTLVGNSAGYGGGIALEWNGGATRLLLSGCTITGNQSRSTFANLGGGALFIDRAATAAIVNSTIAGNTSAGIGGGILFNGGINSVLNVQNSLVVGNTAASGGADFGQLNNGAITDRGGNLIGLPVNTTLGQVLRMDGSGAPLLASNGGSTPTVALVPGSPALDAGLDVTTLATALTATDTSVSVADGTAFAPGVVIQVEGEQMAVTGVSGNTLTVTRGANLTTAASHASGVTVNYVNDQRGPGFARIALGKSGATPKPDIGAVEYTLPQVLYWANSNAKAIGRANLDGTGVNHRFIPLSDNPYGIAVDGTYIYWSAGTTIGRARLDGTGVNPNFIAGLSSVWHLAVNGTHIFWGNLNGLGTTIGRANLDGTGVNTSFISGASQPRGVAVNATHVFWTNFGLSMIGRANLDGTGANNSFAAASDFCDGVFVDKDYLYWSRLGQFANGTTLGRANLDGSGGNANFITGASVPGGGAVSTAGVFWATTLTNSIARANLDGTGVNTGFINGATRPNAVAVGSGFLTPVVTPSTTTLAANSTTLTINGANFDPVAGNNTVVLSNGATGTVTAATATTLTVTFNNPPTISGPMTAVVTTNGVSSGAAVVVGGVPDPGSLVVTTLTDSAPGTPTDYDGLNTLREAITYANTLGVRADITFNVPGGGTIALAEQNAAGARMLPILTNPNGITIDGANGGQGAIIIDGGSTSDTTGDRVFFIGVPDGTPAAAGGNLPSTKDTTWAISNLTIQNGNARGGQGGTSGGNQGGAGGAGLGGGIFVNAGNLRLVSVQLSNHRAVGGNGGLALQALFGAAGSGGMGGNGASVLSNAGVGGGGGFGIGADGGSSSGGNGAPGAFQGAASAGSVGSGGTGGADGGGGGASTSSLNGGAGGGVGGGGTSTGLGGAGGFGGGGGGVGNNSQGNGGFGGGGRTGGFGGGNTGLNGTSPGFGGGVGIFGVRAGGGLGAGGAIFVRQGATVTIIDGGITTGRVVGGTGGNPGQAIGTGVFLAGSATWDVSTGETVTLTDTLGGGTDAQITGGLTKTGGGTLSLGGANSYTGSTTVSAGMLALTNAGALGGSTNISVENGASLTSGGTFNFGTKAFTFNGTGVGGTGALRSVTGSQIFSGQVTLTGDTLLVVETGTLIRMQTAGLTSTGAVALTVESRGNSNFVAAGPFTGITSLTKNGTGGMELSGTNSISGPVSVNAGSLEIYNGSAISDLAQVTVFGSAVFGINASETIGSLAGVNTVLLRDGATLTTGGNNASTLYSGQMGGTGSLVKAGTGTFIMASASVYSGSTTINGGTLQIGNGGTTGELLNTSGIINNANLTFNRSINLTHAKPISGTGTLTKLGAGTLTLTTANSYEGGTTLEAGTLTLTGVGTVGSGPVNFVAGKVATLRAPASTPPTNRIQGFNFGHSIALTSAGTATQATLGANNVLTITGGTDSPIVLNFDPAQNFAGLRFRVATDGSGGTLVTLTIADLNPVISAGSFDLFTATGRPAGSGNFTGNGVNGSSFNPQTVGLGSQTITFTPSDGAPPVTFTVTVTETPSLIVTSLADPGSPTDGQTSLREAIAYAATLTGPQTIRFNGDPLLGPPTTGAGVVHFFDSTPDLIALGGTQLEVASTVTLSGPGADKLTISGEELSRVFFVPFGANLTVAGMTLTRGKVVSLARGGAIHNMGTLFVRECQITNSSAGSGGAVANSQSFATNDATTTILNSTLTGNSASFGGCTSNANRPGNIFTIINCTISGNQSSSGAGGIYVSGTVRIFYSTITENTAQSAGGGIGTDGGSLSLQGSIVAGNVGLTGRPDFLRASTTVVTSWGHNLIGNSDTTNPVAWQASDLLNQNPLLGPLANNGGPTRSHSLLPGSPAINAGSDLTTLSSAVDVGTTSIPVTDASAFPGGAGLILQIGSEQMRVETADTTAQILTVTRAVNGTTASAHAANAPVHYAFDQRGPGFPRRVGVSDIGAFELPNQSPVNTVPLAQTLLEDTSLTFSTANSNALSISDDSTTLSATVSIPSGTGTLTASPSGGASITNNGTAAVLITGSLAQINAALEGLTYQPPADANGTDFTTLTLLTDDGFFQVSSTVKITVTPVNDAPSFNKGTDLTVLEDAGPQTVANWATNLSPGPSNESTQTLSFQVSADAPALFSTAPAIAPNGTLTFTPAANAFGQTTVTVTIRDNGGTANSGLDTSAPQTFQITLTPVNDAPSFTKGADITVLEDAGPQSVATWATNLSPGPANESAQTLIFQVSADAPALFSTAPAIAPNGTLTFTPAPNAFGQTTVAVTVKDNGGTANGGLDTSAPQTFQITITPVNDAPSFTKGTDLTVLEDAGPQTITGWATNLSPGPANESAQTLTFQVSADTPALFSTVPAIAPNGTLTFTPAANAFGQTTVTVTIRDNGGTTNSGLDTSAPQTFQITLTPVNDAPSFTKGSDQIVLEDAGPQSVANWATNLSAGPANESAQTMIFQVSADAPALFSTAPAIAPNGTLTFTPAANAFGQTTVTVTIRDNGGTANSGLDTSAPQTFLITITPVNDAPSFTKGTDLIVLEDAGPQTVANWATNLSPGPSNESAQTLSFQVSADAPALFSTAPAIAPNGTLTFTPTARGRTTVTVTIKDNGGTANGGLDTSAPQTFVITVVERPSLIVTTANDVVDPIDGLTSLREAIAYANSLTGPQTITFANSNANGAVNFHDGTARTITLGGGQLSIIGHVTIDGPGAELLAISGNNASRVFHISGSMVEISDLTIRNGRVDGISSQDGGAGIFNSGTLLLRNSIVSQNSNFGGATAGLGGGISSSGILTVENCIISGNSSLVTGGGVFHNSTLMVRNSTIEQNSSGSGGGISGFSTLTVKSSTISQNSATETNASVGGGGIYNINGMLTVENCTISGNSTYTHGGGISQHSGSLVVQNTTITLNRADADDNGSGSGGGIAVNGSVTVNNSIVGGNVRGSGNTPDDIFGTIATSTCNLVGDAGTAGGIAHGSNGNIVGNGGSGTREIHTVLSTLLSNNGGPTLTHALLPGSPAIDAGSPDFDPAAFTPPLTTDQRGTGFPRVLRARGGTVNGRIDIGAVEAPVPLLEVLGNAQLLTNGQTALSSTDHTDFGPVPFAATDTLTRVFTLRAAVTGPLTVANASLSGPHANDFQITQQSGGAVAAGATAELHLTFRPGGYGPRTAHVTLGGLDADHPTFTFDIGGFGDNSAPTGITLDPAVLLDSSLPGLEVGQLTATDADSADTHVFTLADGDGDTDNAAFRIEGNRLLLTVPIAIASKDRYALRLRATDNGDPAKFVEVAFDLPVVVLQPETSPVGPLTLNPVTGLFEQTLRITNPGLVTLAGLRVTVMNLPPTLQLWNRTHPVLPILEDNTPLAPRAVRDQLIQFYSPLRRLPTGWTPEYRVETIYTGIPALAGDASGQYAALVDRSATAKVSAVPQLGGRVTLTVNRRGSASGVVAEGKTRRAFRSRLTVDSTLPHLPALRAALNREGTQIELVFQPAQQQVRGRLLAAGASTRLSPPHSDEAALSGWRRIWNARTQPASAYLARHHLALENTDPAQGPQGFGYLVVRGSSRSGSCALTGRLPDGTALTGSTFIGPQGQVLLYAPLYRAAGSCRGWLTLTPGSTAPSNNTASGTLDWLKPATTTGPAFGPVELNAEGAAWQRPAPGALLMNLSPSAPGVANARVELSLGPVIADQAIRITSPARGSLLSRVTVLPPNPQAIALSPIASTSGLFTGTFSGGRLYGLIVPTQSNGTIGFGFYLHRNGSGRAELLPSK